MSIEIPPIAATNPIVVQPVAEKTFDTWFLTDFRLVASPDRRFDVEAFWALGRLYNVTEQVTTEQPVTREVTRQKTNPETGLPEVDAEGNPVMETVSETTIETVTSDVTVTKSELSDRRSNCYVRDLLSTEVITKHPEIAAVLPEFLNAITAVSRREGSI